MGGRAEGEVGLGAMGYRKNILLACFVGDVDADC